MDVFIEIRRGRGGGGLNNMLRNVKKENKMYMAGNFTVNVKPKPKNKKDKKLDPHHPIPSHPFVDLPNI